MANPVVTTAQSFCRHALSYRYHYRQTQEATKVLKNIEQAQGKLPAAHRKLCDEYAIDVLGHKQFAPWLYVYAAVSGAFKEGWIPDNYYGAVVVPQLKGDYGAISSLNHLHHTMFQSESFPDILSYVNGIFTTPACGVIPEESAKDYLFESQDRVVFKLDQSKQGTGIHIFDRDSFSPQMIAGLGNGLFQGFIRQNHLFDEFTEKSVATIRITTVSKESGDVSTRSCYLRLGSGDETHVQSASLSGCQLI